MDTEIYISYNFHMSGNGFLFCFVFQPFRNLNPLLMGHRKTDSEWAGSGLRAVDLTAWKIPVPLEPCGWVM